MGENVETIDRYICALDEFLSGKYLQEGGFASCFRADGEFLDRRGKERDWPPFAPMSRVLEPFGMESETLSRAGSEAPWGVKVRFLTEAMRDMAWV